MSNKTERKREEGWGKGVFGERFGENERWGKRVREIDRVGEKWRMERERDAVGEIGGGMLREFERYRRKD